MAKQKDEKPSKTPVALCEEEILSFWKDQDIFQKSLDKPAPQGEYVFYDGPPFATGLPHYGHILGSAVKDTVARYQTMRGFRVERKWGWDCHGLPIENIVEKDLKVAGHKEIQAIGIDTFNEYARSKVLDYVAHWKGTVERMGRWVDFDGSYKTMDNTFIESVWWAFNEIQKKGLVYEGVRVLPYCPRCETPIANSEIAMDHSYKDITDISVYVKLELIDQPGTYLLAWTTTPWTLPGNTAAAVNEDITYTKIQDTKDGIVSNYIIAKDMFETLKEKFTAPEIVGEIKGSDLVGKSYKPLFDYFAKDPSLPNHENGWKVYVAPYVTTESGTGIVHLAPAYGEEDMDLAKKFNIPFVRHVGPDGRFTAEVTDFAGEKAKPKEDHQAGDVLIIKYLAKERLLFAKEKIVHSYPHCFRCETPLYYFALDAWFINIQKVKARMLQLNQSIDWVPAHLKDGRFGKSMEGAPDWNISRNRYWASPLPIWVTADKKEKIFVDSIDTLKRYTKKSGNKYFVMRHGGTDGNIKNIISFAHEDNDHLTETGREGVVTSAEALKGHGIDLIITSPFARTRETAEIVAQTLGLGHDAVIVDERLHEMNPGDFDGKDWNAFHVAMSDMGSDWFTSGVPRGESPQNVMSRVGALLYDIESKYKDKKIIMVTHGGPAWLLYVVAGLSAPDQKQYKIPDMRISTTNIFVDGFRRFENAEVRELPFVPLPHNANFGLDLHRPYIDKIVLEKDGKEFRRIPEVFDCWFESGSMPFAQRHYPFENGEWFKSHFPAQFIAEYIAQTRTWFYYMHAVSTMLFDSIAFEHVVTTGTVLAEDGQKMSKSKENFPDPSIIFDRYGVDALRFYLLSSPLMKSEDLNFSEKGVDETYKKLILRTRNILAFYTLYRGADMKGVTSKHVLDQWILARAEQMLKETTLGMEVYELDRAHAPIGLFVEDLSTWYVRRSRDRLKDADKEAIATFYQVLSILAKVLAPFAPFLAEDIYKTIRSEDEVESVHLTDWPAYSAPSVGDTLVLSLMKEVRDAVTLGLEVRARSGVKIRQPLQTLTLRSDTLKGQAPYLGLLQDEVNVKEIAFDINLTEEATLDLHLSDELKLEGEARELIRAIQELRKAEGLEPKDTIAITVQASAFTIGAFKAYEDEIKKTCMVTDAKLIEKDLKDVTAFTISIC